MKRTLTLKDCSVVREGVSASGKAWTMYNCVDSENRKYTSFTNMSPYLNADREYEVGQKESTKTNPKTGKPYLNYTIDLPKLAPKTSSGELEILNRMDIKLDKILAKVDSIETMLDAIPEEKSDDVPPIDDKDIPF